MAGCVRQDPEASLVQMEVHLLGSGYGGIELGRIAHHPQRHLDGRERHPWRLHDVVDAMGDAACDTHEIAPQESHHLDLLPCKRRQSLVSHW